jgi:hypothetical protein
LNAGIVKSFRTTTRKLLAELGDVPAETGELTKKLETDIKEFVAAKLKELWGAIHPAVNDRPEASPGPAPTPVKLAGLREVFPHQVLNDDVLIKLDSRLAAATAGEYSSEAFVDFCRQRNRRSTAIQFGAVLKKGGLADEFLGLCQQAQKQHQAERERQTRRAEYGVAMSAGSTFAEYCERHQKAIPADPVERDALEERWLNGKAPDD